MTIFLPMLFVLLTTPVHVVYVNGPEVDKSRREILRAFAYWNELGPCNPRLYISQESHITLEQPLDFFQYRSMATEAPVITLYVVENGADKKPLDLGGGGSGFAFSDPHSKAIVSTTHYLDDHGYYVFPALGPMVAHELGHKLYNLPHNEEETSIMSFPEAAYLNWIMHRVDYQLAATQCKG